MRELRRAAEAARAAARQDGPQLVTDPFAPVELASVAAGATVALAFLATITGTGLPFALLPFVRQARRLGALQAVDQLGLADPPGRAPVPGASVTELPAELVTAVHDLARVVDDQIERSTRLLRVAETDDDLDTALAVAERAEHRATAVVVTTVHEAVATGTEDAAADLAPAVRELHGREPVLLWVPERDACLHCLEYAGAAKVDGRFEPAQSFLADGARRWPSAEHPPLHPHCRCQLLAWNGVDGLTDDGAFPDALQREARRSVVKAWALPSEGQGPRRRAAEALLARGAGLPRTVEERARAAVRSKRFKTRPAPP